MADLRVLAEIGLFDDCGAERADFKDAGLNALIARGNDVCGRVRRRLQQALDAEPTYFRLQERSEIFLLPLEQVMLVSPVRVGDYARVQSDAYTHARASSLCLSGGKARGTEVQAQFGFVIGEGADGQPLATTPQAHRHVFGLTLLVSFRESGTVAYPEPLTTALSPWVTPLEAILPNDGPALQSALQLTPYRHAPELLPLPDYQPADLDPAAALATLTADGARLRPGDLVSWNASVPYHDGLSPGDALRYEVTVPTSAGDIRLAAVCASLRGPDNA